MSLTFKEIRVGSHFILKTTTELQQIFQDESSLWSQELASCYESGPILAAAMTGREGTVLEIDEHDQSIKFHISGVFESWVTVELLTLPLSLSPSDTTLTPPNPNNPDLINTGNRLIDDVDDKHDDNLITDLSNSTATERERENERESNIHITNTSHNNTTATNNDKAVIMLDYSEILVNEKYLLKSTEDLLKVFHNASSIWCQEMSDNYDEQPILNAAGLEGK